MEILSRKTGFFYYCKKTNDEKPVIICSTYLLYCFLSPKRFFYNKQQRKANKETKAKAEERKFAQDFLKDKPVITSKPVNGKVAVKIDAKTTVYVKPGSDINAVKKMFADHDKEFTSSNNPRTHNKKLYKN